MEHDEIMGARLSAIEARLSGIEQRQAAMERDGMVTPKRRKRELTPEERQAVRARLLAGQEKARARREAEVQAEVTAEEAPAAKAPAKRILQVED